EAFGFLSVMVEAVLKMLVRRAALVTAAISSAIMGNIALGESYIAIILGGQLFKGAFDDADIDSSVLSRSLEEGSTLTTGLIPWTTSGAFYAATLGVPTLDYIQWSFLNWINPLIGILFAWLGIALFRKRVATDQDD
ncbi:MAG: hypothetical protein KDI36_18890, partial [Pseudomonadales bacterium]|nr:hypothetical protein [Pseudomonadales bacterium]